MVMCTWHPGPLPRAMPRCTGGSRHILPGYHLGTRAYVLTPARVCLSAGPRRAEVHRLRGCCCCHDGSGASASCRLTHCDRCVSGRSIGGWGVWGVNVAGPGSLCVCTAGCLVCLCRLRHSTTGLRCCRCLCRILVERPRCRELHAKWLLHCRTSLNSDQHHLRDVGCCRCALQHGSQRVHDTPLLLQGLSCCAGHSDQRVSHAGDVAIIILAGLCLILTVHKTRQAVVVAMHTPRRL
mmetsp:Transcript_13315/g.28470  ORF Transcript_13315/g.28470 Transcript_13315/m.28470 type:complete len:238 (-) Transcript_13315:543-1256(-)